MSKVFHWCLPASIAILRLAVAVGMTTPLSAEVTVSQALKNSEAELKLALERLTNVRELVAEEKIPIAAEFEAVNLELREKRRLARIARMTKEDREQRLGQLERDFRTRDQDAIYAAGLLKEHALKTQTLGGPGEPAMAINPDMLAADLVDSASGLRERLEILDASFDRLEKLVGGSQAEGKAVDEEGNVADGKFVAVGPLRWFKSVSGSGPVSWSPGEDMPLVVSVGNEQELAQVLEGKEALLGVDVTGGMARAMDEVDGGVIDLVKKGGLWVWPIIFLAALSFGFGLVKLISFAKFREPGDAWVSAISSACLNGDKSKAQALASGASHPASPVIVKLIELSTSSVEAMEEALYEQLMTVQQKVTSLLPVIAVTAATVPLLGLLGTVSGMIRTFNLITLFGSGDPKPLAGGISEALITTLFGLVVAIPALILHAFLSRRSQGLIQSTERLGLVFINAIRKS